MTPQEIVDEFWGAKTPGCKLCTPDDILRLLAMERRECEKLTLRFHSMDSEVCETIRLAILERGYPASPSLTVGDAADGS